MNRTFLGRALSLLLCHLPAALARVPVQGRARPRFAKFEARVGEIPRFLRDGVLAFSRYLDEVVSEGGQMRFRSKIAILDNFEIPRAISTPI